jgi:hypothetical protein
MCKGLHGVLGMVNHSYRARLRRQEAVHHRSSQDSYGDHGEAERRGNCHTEPNGFFSVVHRSLPKAADA